MRAFLGPKADQYVADIEALAPLFGRANVEFAYGDIYGDEDCPLDTKTRKLITLGVLTVQGSSLPQLKVHIEGALHLGVTPEEIIAVITQMIAYCGFPAATNALMTAKSVFEAHNLL